MPVEFTLLEWFVYYLIAINMVAFFAFMPDKVLAESGSWRLSEVSLLGWAFAGGTLGAYAARSLLRHKTRKEPFSNRLHAIACIQVILFATLMLWFTTR